MTSPDAHASMRSFPQMHAYLRAVAHFNLDVGICPRTAHAGSERDLVDGIDLGGDLVRFLRTQIRTAGILAI